MSMETPKSSDQGSRARFVPTRWSLVAKASNPNAAIAREAMEELVRAYWWPMYAYVRGLRTTREDAADIVQGLLTNLLETRRLESAGVDRGRFRNWIRAALKFHMGHDRERAATLKRGGTFRTIGLDEAEAERRWNHVANRNLDPDRLFDRAWALEVIRHAASVVEQAYAARGKSALFDALKHTLVPGTGKAGFAGVAARLGKSEGAVKVEAQRLRVRYQKALRDEVRSTVEDPRDADAEFKELLAALQP